MGCNCIDRVDAALAPRNTRIGVMFGVMPVSKSRATTILAPQVVTVKADPKKRGAVRAVAAIFCPFCGVRIVDELRAGRDGFRDKEHAAGIAGAHDEKSFLALARIPVERRAVSTSFPLWHV